MSQAVIEKVRKLMAIAGNSGASDGEIAAAMHQASRLMERHHLSEADLNHSPEDDLAAVDAATFGDYRAWIGRRAYTWELALGQFVRQFVGVPMYHDTEVHIVREMGIAKLDDSGNPIKGQSLVFYGVADDAAIAVHLYNELRMTIATMARIEYGTIYKGDGGAYAEGFVLGLIRNFQEASQRSHLESETAAQFGDKNALVLVRRRDALISYKETRARAWLAKERGVNLGRGRSRSGASGSTAAQKRGERDGRATSVSKHRSRKLANQ